MIAAVLARCVPAGWSAPVATLLWLVAGPAAAQDSTLAEIATYAGTDRAERLLAGARREGTLSLYTSVTVEDMGILGAAFEKKYGVKLRVWRGSSETILQRGIVEARGGRFDADAFETGATAMESLHREKLLQSVTSPAFADLAPAAVRSHREWIGTRYNLFVAAYNTRLVARDDLPNGYDDLTDRKWKGRLGIEAEDSDWFGALVSALGEARGLQLFRDIVATNGMSVRKGHTLMANLVVSGEVPLALSTYAYKAAQLKRSGAPLDWLVLPPALARFEGIGIARRAPHPHAALLFLDFMLTDAQDILASRDFLPSSQKVRPLAAGLTFIEPARALDESAKWSKYFRDIVTRPAR